MLSAFTFVLPSLLLFKFTVQLPSFHCIFPLCSCELFNEMDLQRRLLHCSIFPCQKGNLTRLNVLPFSGYLTFMLSSFIHELLHFMIQPDGRTTKSNILEQQRKPHWESHWKFIGRSAAHIRANLFRKRSMCLSYSTSPHKTIQIIC